MSIKDYWIEELQSIKEFKILSEVEDSEFLKLKGTLKNLIDDQFIETATEKGIARREKILKIQPFADDNLESRKFRVNSKWNMQLPYAYRRLIEKISDLVGENGYEIELIHNEYKLNVKVCLARKRMLNDVDALVRDIAPTNLIINVSLKYNRYYELKSCSYGDLKDKTYLEVIEEVLF